ncbi:hypothetical protein DFH06DRAFT_1208370 [Mycena polygramma]|nr:hypothetical protein DFH06DRAFT_1208370 [Mycena polygramma]
MHPSLRLSNVSKLPSALRRTATAAASGSPRELQKLVEDLRKALVPPEYRTLLLPPFYANLDPAEIPLILESLDATPIQTEAIRFRIVQVLGNLKIVSILGRLNSVSLDAFVDLWLRVWPWIEFLDEYQDHVPGIEHFSRTQRYSIYVALLLLFRHQNEASALMDSTGGAYVVVGKAWSHFVHRYGEDARHLYDVCHFLSFSHGLWGNDGAREQNPFPFKGLITGAGGTRTDFASLVVSHLDRVVGDPDPRQIVDSGAGILLVLGSDLSLRDALLVQGIVPPLTTAVLALSSSPSDIHAVVLDTVFPALIDCLRCFPCHRWVTESLRAGLLRIVFSRPYFPKSGDCLRALLDPGSALSRSTVYHSVLSQLRSSLLEIRDRDAAAAFGDPEILEHWARFLALAENRFQVVDLYNTGASTFMRACDNMECAKIERKRNLKRCGGCLRSYYCSQICQAEDWRRGMHRQWCGVISLARHRDLEVRARDRSFLRALLHHDYLARREDIALRHLPSLKMNPSGAPHTLFDYTAGTCGEINLADYQGDDSHYDGDAARLVTSGGRMELHFMATFNGREEAQIWKFPLHLASTELIQGMRAIADTVPPNATPKDLELYRPLVRDLLHLNILATH